MFTVEIKGLAEVLAKIEAYSKEMADGIDKELDVAANNIVTMAKAMAPKGRTHQLSDSINADISVRFSKIVRASASYAPFVEFGTGSHVFETPEFNFTPEMREYAKEFYVSGKGRLYPRPFLFPSYQLEIKKLQERIKNIIFKDVKL